MSRLRRILFLAALIAFGARAAAGAPSVPDGNARSADYSELVASGQEADRGEADLGEGSFAIAGDGFPDGCAACGFDGPCCEPLWSVRADALFLTRGTPHHSAIIRRFSDDRVLLSAADFDNFTWSAGTDVEIARRLDRGSLFDWVNVRYFGAQSMASYANLNTVGPWSYDSTPPGYFYPAGLIDAYYRAQLYSTEANLQHDIDGSYFSWLIGVRWLQLNEQMENTLTAGSTIHNLFTTQNNLYGAQVGLVVETPPFRRRFSLRWAAKVGLYGNAARNYWTLEETALSISRDTRGQAACVGDIYGLLTWQWTEHVALNVGYQMLWVEGVAVVGDQVAAFHETAGVYPGDGINSGGGAFFQGALAGLTVNW